LCVTSSPARISNDSQTITMSILKKQLERNSLVLVEDGHFDKPVYSIIFVTKNKKDVRRRSTSEIAYKLYYVGEKEKFSPRRQRWLLKKGEISTPKVGKRIRSKTVISQS
jgi:hypothetical protein